jgi:single-stranded DNA-binding protein
MIDALIAGRVFGKPAERTAANGKPYATAKVRVPTRAGDALFVRVIAFDAEARRALLALSDGDSVTLAGELTPKVWVDKEGNARPAVDLLAHGVLTQYHVARKRKLLRDLEDTAKPGDLPFGDQFPRVA